MKPKKQDPNAWNESPEYRENRLARAASVLMEHERARPATVEDRVQIIMRLMTERRWKRITTKALAHRLVWDMSPVTIHQYASEASRRLRTKDEDLIEKRHMLALNVFKGALQAESLPLAPRLELQTKALKATDGMFARAVRVEVRVDEALAEFSEKELGHFAEVAPEDCIEQGCKVHDPAVIKRLVEGRT